MGTAVIRGIRVPVTGVSLRESRIFLSCTLRGPVPAVSGGPVTIFGADGTGICQGDCDGLSWPEVGPDEMLMVSIDMRMEMCHGEAR
jgi:hypothetical protein